MNDFAFALEDEDLFEDFDDEGELDDDFDDAFAGDDDLDDLSERRRRRRRLPRRIRVGRIGRGRGLFQRRPSGKFATQAQLKAGLARVGKQIGANGQAIKKVAAQANRANRQIVTATNRLDKEIGGLKKEVKKQAESTLLLTLLQPKPVLEAANPEAPTARAGQVVGSVQVKQPSNLLPLVLMSGSGGLGGDSNMLFLALALSGQL